MDIQKGDDIKRCDNPDTSLITLEDFVEGDTDEDKKKNYDKFIKELIYIGKPFGNDNKRHCATITELYKFIMIFQIRKQVREYITGDIDISVKIRNPITGSNFTIDEIKFIKSKAIELGIDKLLENELNQTRQREENEYQQEMRQFETEVTQEVTQELPSSIDTRPHVTELVYQDSPFDITKATTLEEFLEEQYDILIEVFGNEDILINEMNETVGMYQRSNDGALYRNILKREYTDIGIVKLFDIITLFRPRITKKAIDFVHSLVFKSKWQEKWNSLHVDDQLFFYHLYGMILELEQDDLNFISSIHLLQELFINRGEFFGARYYIQLDLQQEKFKSCCILMDDVSLKDKNGNPSELERTYTGKEPSFSDIAYILLIYGDEYLHNYVDTIMEEENFQYLMVGVNIVEDIQDNNLLVNTKNYWENKNYEFTIDNWAIKGYRNEMYQEEHEDEQQGGVKHKVIYRKKRKSSKKKKHKSSNNKRKTSKKKRKSLKRKSYKK
jgi:hypothetical protein